MSLSPVQDKLRGGQAVIAWTVEAADLLTPVAAFLKLRRHLAGADRNSFLLESIEGGVARGRYSVIGLLPDRIWRCRTGTVTVSRDGDSFTPIDAHPIESLREQIEANRIDLPAALPPMIGGLFGYLGYDMVRQMERLPNSPTDDLGLPEAMLLRPSLFAVFDNVRDELTLAVPLRPDGEHHADVLWDRGQALLARARDALSLELPLANARVQAVATIPIEPRSNFTREAFLDVVGRVQEYIAAGDAFQVVPSQRFSAPFEPPPIALYRALRRINPAPFLFFLDLSSGQDRFQLVGSSPEVLVRLREGTVTVRPLAGTRPRGADRAEDERLEAELLGDPKERAEHLMLVDLGRNDVGRVAMLGSVKVTESFTIERFSHVMHISSTVEGTLRPELDAVDALIAGFPAGTLTGAPKIRAMQIIDEMEPTRRGTYAGCIGYFGADGAMDTCIGLRMALIKDGTMHVQAGCGVVADSVAEAEYEETKQKARALFRAAEVAIAQNQPYGDVQGQADAQGPHGVST